MRVIESKKSSSDLDRVEAEALAEILADGIEAGKQTRETYGCDEMGGVEYHIALIPYVDLSGARRWAVLHGDPSSSDWRDTDSLEEADAFYERTVREVTESLPPYYDEDGAEQPLWDVSDVDGVPALSKR